jgi:hypothetical protein
VPNPDQADFDNDGEGDACDGDDLFVPAIHVTSVPGEPARISWEAENAATGYVLFLGPISQIAAPLEGFCGRPDLQVPETRMVENPAPGEGIWYLVAAEAGVTRGSFGEDSAGTERPSFGACDASLAADWDQDGVPNRDDPCPFDPGCSD